MNYEISITRRCNFSCPGCNALCNIVSDASSDMTTEELESVIDQINTADPAPGQIIVIGGEPTLHPRCIEYCKYIKEHIKSRYSLRIESNCSNQDIISAVEAMGYHVGDYLGSRDGDELRRIKANVHYETMLSPAYEGMPRNDPKTCFVLNGLSGTGPCGLTVHKYRGRLTWCYCPGAGSLCKLLQREDEFMFPTLADLLSSDMDRLRSEICVHCMAMAKHRIYAKDSGGRVSECFAAGLAAYRKYGEDAEAAASSGDAK